MIRNKGKFNRAILEMVNAVNGKNLSISLFLISFIALVPAIRAHIAEFDEYWQQRALEAKNNTLNVYHPNPEQVTNEFNLEVHRAISGSRISNTTRRLSGGHKKHIGPCLATNPIDKCWRCDSLWAQNRKKLADCVLGFGRNTRGGKFGSYYVVTDASDNDMANPRPGTLRHAVTRNRPLWIYFARSMIIRLNQELIVASDKTIDARGANVRIVGGAGITIQFVNNVIIHGLHIHHIVKGNGGMIMDKEDHVGFRTQSDGDGISIFGSTNIWIDHISISKCDDGSIDATEGSTGITISNCHFTHHVKVMLLGASGMSTQDKMMQVTVAFNHFGKELKERMPRVRWGFVHVVNNDYTHWMGYAIGGSHQPTIISQGNRFIAPNDPRAKEVTKREYVAESVWRNWLWKSEGDIMMNGAFFVTSGNPNQQLWFSSLDIIKAELGNHVGHLTRFAGSVDCFVGKPC